MKTQTSINLENEDANYYQPVWIRLYLPQTE